MGKCQHYDDAEMRRQPWLCNMLVYIFIPDLNAQIIIATTTYCALQNFYIFITYVCMYVTVLIKIIFVLNNSTE